VSTLQPARRGRFTRGTRIAWDTLATWLAGVNVLHNRLCAGRNVSDALARHGIALAEELELVATASRGDLDKLLDLLACRRTTPWALCEPVVGQAREKVLAAATNRDRHLRRLDGEPESSTRRRWIILLLHHEGVRELYTEPMVRAENAGFKALQQYRSDSRDAKRVLLLVGFDWIEFFGLGDGLKLTPQPHEQVQAPRVPWHQIWRPEVRRWCADLIDQRLRASLKSEASQMDTHSSETA